MLLLLSILSVSDASGILKMEEVGNYPLKYELLDSNVKLSRVCLFLKLLFQ